MKFDFQLLYVMIVIGLLVKKLDSKVWIGAAMLVFVWMMFNWLHK